MGKHEKENYRSLSDSNILGFISMRGLSVFYNLVLVLEPQNVESLDAFQVKLGRGLQNVAPIHPVQKASHI